MAPSSMPSSPAHATLAANVPLDLQIARGNSFRRGGAHLSRHRDGPPHRIGTVRRYRHGQLGNPARNAVQNVGERPRMVGAITAWRSR